MKIPTSVIAMSLLTAVPFGLAIRDSVKHHDSDSDDDELDFDGSRASAREERRAMERYEEEARTEEQTTREAHDKSKRDLARVYGPTPASFGSLFDGLRLGVPVDQAPPAARKAVDGEAEGHPAFRSSFDVDPNDKIKGLTIQIYDSCEDFGSTLETAWGSSHDSIWIDPAAHQRASFDSIGCTLTFDRLAEVDQWIDKTDTAIVPLALIGQPIAKIADRVPIDDLDDSTDGTGISNLGSYYDLGIGRGKQETTVTVYAKKKKIVGFNVSVATDAETADRVIARLTKLYGAPKHDDVYGYSDWKGRLPLHLEMTSTHLVIQAGSIPQ
jgi:hypothetical protein